MTFFLRNRPDLAVLVMSATLDGERLARFLDAPRLKAIAASAAGGGSARSASSRKSSALIPLHGRTAKGSDSTS